MTTKYDPEFIARWRQMTAEAKLIGAASDKANNADRAQQTRRNAPIVKRAAHFRARSAAKKAATSASADDGYNFSLGDIAHSVGNTLGAAMHVPGDYLRSAADQGFLAVRKGAQELGVERGFDQALGGINGQLSPVGNRTPSFTDFINNADAGYSYGQFQKSQGQVPQRNSVVAAAQAVAGDIASDPLTYVGGSAVLAHGTKATAAAILDADRIAAAADKAVQAGEYVDKASAIAGLTVRAKAAATQVLRHGASSLSREQMTTHLGDTGGLKLLGKTVVPQEITHYATRPIAESLQALRRAPGIHVPLDAMSGKYGAALGDAMRSGAVDRAMPAFEAQRTIALADSREGGFVHNLLGTWQKGLSVGRFKGVDDSTLETVRAAAQGDMRAVGALGDMAGGGKALAAHEFITQQMEQGLRNAGVEVGHISDYTPRMWSDELKQVMIDGQNGIRTDGQSFLKTRLKQGENFLGQTIGKDIEPGKMTAAQGEAELQRIANETFGEDAVKMFNTNLRETIPITIRAVGRTIRNAEVEQSLRGKGVIVDALTGEARAAPRLAAEADAIGQKIASAEATVGKANRAARVAGSKAQEADTRLAALRANTATAEEKLNHIPADADAATVAKTGADASLARANQLTEEIGVKTPHPLSDVAKTDGFTELRDVRLKAAEADKGAPLTTTERKKIVDQAFEDSKAQRGVTLEGESDPSDLTAARKAAEDNQIPGAQARLERNVRKLEKKYAHAREAEVTPPTDAADELAGAPVPARGQPLDVSDSALGIGYNAQTSSARFDAEVDARIEALQLSPDEARVVRLALLDPEIKGAAQRFAETSGATILQDNARGIVVNVADPEAAGLAVEGVEQHAARDWEAPLTDAAERAKGSPAQDARDAAKQLTAEGDAGAALATNAAEEQATAVESADAAIRQLVERVKARTGADVNVDVIESRIEVAHPDNGRVVGTDTATGEPIINKLPPKVVSGRTYVIDLSPLTEARSAAANSDVVAAYHASETVSPAVGASEAVASEAEAVAADHAGSTAGVANTAPPTASNPDLATAVDDVSHNRPELTDQVDPWRTFVDNHPDLVSVDIRSEVLANPMAYPHEMVAAAVNGDVADGAVQYALERAYGPDWRDSIDASRYLKNGPDATPVAVAHDVAPMVDRYPTADQPVVSALDANDASQWTRDPAATTQAYTDTLRAGDEQAALLYRAAQEDADAAHAAAARLQANAATARKTLSDKSIFETMTSKDTPQVAEAVRGSVARGMKQLLHDPTLAAPADVADALAVMTKIHEPNGIENFLDHSLKPIVDYLKTWEVASPGFHVRNFFGNAFQNWIAGVDFSSYSGFRTVRDALNERYALGGDSSKLWDALSTSDRKIAEQIHALNLRGPFSSNFVTTGESPAGSITSGIDSKLSQAVPSLGDHPLGTAEHYNPLGTRGPLSRASVKFGGHHMEIGRGAMAYDIMKKGGTAEDAVAAIDKFHFDYGDYSAFERQVKRVIPFYTFTRHNMPLQIEMMFRQPRKYVPWMYAKQELESQVPADQAVPSYFSEGLFPNIRTPLTAGGGHVYANDFLPSKDLNNATSDPVALVAGMLTPVLKVPLEHAVGHRFFKGFAINDKPVAAPATWQAIPGFMQALQLGGAADTVKGQWVVKSSALDDVEQGIPTLAVVRRLLPSEPKYTQRALTSWASWMFGSAFRTNTAEQQQSVVNQKAKSEAFAALDSFNKVPYKRRSSQDYRRRTAAFGRLKQIDAGKGPQVRRAG